MSGLLPGSPIKVEACKSLKIPFVLKIKNNWLIFVSHFISELLCFNAQHSGMLNPFVPD